MFVERKGSNPKSIHDIFAGETFEYDGHIFIKTNKSDGFDENGSYSLIVDLGSGDLTSIHENMMVNFVKKSKVVIE